MTGSAHESVQERALDELLDRLGEGFLVLDREYRVIRVNAEGLRVDGRPAQHLLGRTHWEVWPASVGTPVEAAYRRVMDDRVKVELEHHYVDESAGQDVWLELRIYPAEEGVAAFYRDVTSRKRAEEERDRSVRLLEAFIEAVPGVVYAKDLHGRMLVANRGTTELIGKPPEAYLGKTDVEFLENEQQAAAVMATDRRIMTSGVAEQVQEVVSFPDGRRAIWLSTKAPMRGESGQVIGLIGSSIDITDRSALQETSRRFDAILNNTREAVFMMDERQHCVFANAAAEKLTGYCFAELSGRPLHDVIHNKKPDGSHYPLEECPIDRAFPERAQMSGEELFVHKDGSLDPVAFTASPVLDERGEPIGTVIEARNIAHRKAREAALARRTEQLQALAGAALEVAAAPTLESTLDVVTEAARRIIGAHQGVVSLTRGPDWSQAINAVALTEKYEAWRDYAALPDGGGVYSWLCEENRSVRFTQAELEAHPRWRGFGDHASEHPPMRGWLAAPLVGRDGRNLGLIQLSDKEDGSEFDEADEAMLVQLAQLASAAVEQNLAETALRHLNATLESRVEQAIAERERVEEALRQSQKMEAVGQLTGGVAHDFNNLLTVVTGNIDMALRNLAAAGLAEGRIKRSLDNALKGADRAAALTQRLLAFSRRQPLDPKPLNVDRLVADMSDLLNRALGETVRLEVVTSPGLWRVEADPNQLESAILNLAVNARDAMPTGGTLTVETANARLDEGYAADHAEVAPGQYVMIAVTDTGTGMPKGVAARVFEPFFTTKEVGRGTGLGLSQVYGFTKQSGGHVKVYSEEGSGTTVKIYLPRLMSGIESEPEDSRYESRPETTRGSETIMVVEDDDDVRTYTVECLRELGYRVLEAHDGPAALRLLERQEKPIDLLFTDVVMPGMTGRELADQARELQPDLRVLYTSGYTRNAIVHGGRLDEGVEMIVKPFTFATLAEKVADVLEQGRTGRLLLVEDDANLRMFAAEALASAGYMVDEASGAAEALSRIRAARGRYDAVVLDIRLPDRAGDSIAAEVRALHADMPILIASGEHAQELAERFAEDRCIGVIAKPYNAARLATALTELGVRCRSATPA